jgi:hypothetical protein
VRINKHFAKVNIKKTEFMVVERPLFRRIVDPTNAAEVEAKAVAVAGVAARKIIVVKSGEETLCWVDSFSYIGSLTCCDGSMEKEIKTRINNKRCRWLIINRSRMFFNISNRILLISYINFGFTLCSVALWPAASSVALALWPEAQEEKPRTRTWSVGCCCFVDKVLGRDDKRRILAF